MTTPLKKVAEIIAEKNLEIEERNILLGKQQGMIQTLEGELKVKNEALTVIQESIKPQEFQVWFGLFTALVGSRDIHYSKMEYKHIADSADRAALEFWIRFGEDGCNANK